ncbi:MAG TPA: hypothetical protein VK735_03645 [Pseudonocardia sp.]|uniref:hypothetical protein n=1 Tax=Pseudonocardia sp. TaxID=60912 RepID=UPI002B6A44F6|nr:hypothetical protein [Pseudonocardia sp.]HTF46522.1 hypothetical protein [Pseudonocardia sp.]
MVHAAPGPQCPLCNEDMAWVLGPEPVPQADAHWMCPDGDRWHLCPEHGELRPFYLATRLMAEDD